MSSGRRWRTAGRDSNRGRLRRAGREEARVRMRTFAAIARPAIWLMLLIVLLVATCQTAAAQSGKQEYDKYCAMCHGTDAKGNGDLLQTVPMNPPPPDLTQPKKKKGGIFPFEGGVKNDGGAKGTPF